MLSMVGSIPKFMSNRFLSIMKNKMLNGLSPDPVIAQKALKDVDLGLQGGDEQRFAIVFYILHILCYLKGKHDTNINDHIVKYEDILNNPRKELEKIVSFLGRDKDNIDYTTCLEAMNKDSQAQSEDLSKEKLAAFKQKNPVTPELVNKIDNCFQEYGLPPSKNFDDVFRRTTEPDDR